MKAARVKPSIDAKTAARIVTGRRLCWSRGFTLIELMVSLALGTLILLALTLVFSRNTGNQSELERSTRMLESARFALDILSENILHAGYYGPFNPDLLDPPSPPALKFSAPDPCEDRPRFLGWDTATVTPTLPPAIRGVGALEVPACLANRRAGTQAITLRHMHTGAPIPLDSMEAGNLYLQVSRCGHDPSSPPELRQIFAGIKGDNFPLKNLACNAVTDSVRRFVSRTYYIANCNDCSSGGDGILTLKRVELVNGALQTTSLAEGIENLQVEYGVDTNSDGWPDEFVRATEVHDTQALADAAGFSARVWWNVVSARVHLLARNTQPTPDYTDPRTYVLGPGVSVAPADAFKRTLMTSTVRLVNVGGRREL